MRAVIVIGLLASVCACTETAVCEISCPESFSVSITDGAGAPIAAFTGRLITATEDLAFSCDGSGATPGGATYLCLADGVFFQSTPASAQIEVTATAGTFTGAITPLYADAPCGGNACAGYYRKGTVTVAVN